MERWEPDHISNMLTSENDRVALRLAWFTASRWGEIALLRKENFIPHPQTKEALIVDWGALQKTFKIDSHRAARYVVIGGEGAKRVRGVTTGMVEGERLTTLTTRTWKMYSDHSARQRVPSKEGHWRMQLQR
ncbi:putative retrotransposon hot spot protein (RHS) [Trypanosoma grayi]|uniref:putative retrotransposon hot spot protein (RHS) n=1 Tax=Trypanosoma grayi TaxID=71804 RepID=UPI0004F41E53|nr:putative retrotransposon hot spot protein (RHS) [Trypanosoma grayi]KEG08684.1 putative retrotransposon hot spot protein (RHS) [Trypanosoma grayi]